MLSTLVLATSAHADVGFTCTPDEGGGIVGLAPLEVTCEVIPPEEGTWTEATWTFGDGSLVAGDSVTYTYEDQGQYTVSVQLEDFEGPGDELGDPHHEEYGYVTVCGVPHVRFSWVNKGGLDYELVNKTVVQVHCIDSLLWEIFEGPKAVGEPKFAFETWGPRFDIPSEGQWTVRLTVGGLAGNTVAEATLDAKYKLTDDLTEGPKAYPCATASWTSVPWMVLGALALGYRRRRAR